MTALQRASKKLTQPRFRVNQLVSFVGGSGRIKNSQPSLQTWTYLVEMEMEPRPVMGRVGFETTILLEEIEIQNVVA